MSLYIHSVTAICPESLIEQANHLAACLGIDKDDVKTFAHANWQDAQGNKYAHIHAAIKQGFIDGLQQPLQRPEWDINETVDVEAAQALLADSVFYNPEEHVLADLLPSTKLIYMLNVDPTAIQAQTGLYQGE